MGVDHRIRDGSQAELIAAAWLVEQGCYVYQPVMSQGPIDLIALAPDGQMHLFDVKKASRRENGTYISRKLKKKQREMGIRLLYVDLGTGSCALYPHQLYASMTVQHKAIIGKASNRRFGGGIVPTIAGLLHPEQQPTTQSSSVVSSQYEHQSSAEPSDPHTEPDDADQSDALGPLTAPYSQD